LGGPVFSVVIPTLNEEKYLKRCSKSLSKQVYRDFEVIVVDGGSDDRTVKMAEREGFKVIQAKKRRPHDVGYARNLGAKHSSGSILFFLDADMVLEPNCFQVLNECFEEPSIIGVACKSQPYGGNTVEVLMYDINNHLIELANYLDFYELSYFSCRAYRRTCFMKAGGFREDLLACEDLDLALRIKEFGDYTVTDKTTYWTSPRRLRKWSYSRYVRRYLKYLTEYYLWGYISDFYKEI